MPMIPSTCSRTARQRDPERFERLRGEPFALVDQAEQDVLGPDVVVIEEPRFFLREHDDPPSAISETLEHAKERRCIPAVGRRGAWLVTLRARGLRRARVH